MFNLPFGPMDPNLLTELLRREMLSPGRVPGPVPGVELKPGYRPPSGGLSAMPDAKSVPGFNIKSGLDALSEGLSTWKPRKPPDPGEEAQREAIANDPAVQANPATSAAGLTAGTNPDVAIGGGLNLVPDGSTGVGTSPYARAPDFLEWLFGRQRR
jgi:hypothetical protein